MIDRHLGRTPRQPPPQRTRSGSAWVVATLWITLQLHGGVAPAASPGPASVTYTGCCDASAGAPVSPDLMATASDEDNVLRLYRRHTGGPVVQALNLSSFLVVSRREEADLEAAARLGDRVYWIGSHSRNADGEPRPARHVLFATDLRTTGTNLTLVPTGRPWRTLVSELARHPETRSLQLEAAAARPAEARGGLNIEGLAAGPGGSLWIGFRNPVPGGLALVIPLLNPAEVITGAPAQFGAVLRPDLAGLGIRDFARGSDGYWILAGPAEGGGRHRLFRWNGPGSTPTEVPGAVPKGFQAESVIADTEPAGRAEIMLLGDEGGEKVSGRRCEDLPDFTQRRFRAVTVLGR
ncbi:MAG: DUF3616 domain-containing protein [Verrucomicrobiales bacterium]|nr:DUF3616 domain-containing protein [Verrucomicrobiales bacterium]